MIAASYSYPLLRKSLKKMLAICASRQNRLFCILLPFLMCATLLKNQLSIKVSMKFSQVLDRKAAVHEYFYAFLVAESIGAAVAFTYNITISRLYAVSMRAALQDCMHMERRHFKQRPLGYFFECQITRGESLSLFVAAIVQRLFSNTAFLGQGLYELVGECAMASAVVFVSVVLHSIVFTIVIKKGNALQHRYLASKVALGTAIIDEVRNYDIVKTYNMEANSMRHVHIENVGKRDMMGQLSLLKASSHVLYKTIELAIVFILLAASTQWIISSRMVYIFDLSFKIHKALREIIMDAAEGSMDLFTFYMFDHNLSDAPGANVVALHLKGTLASDRIPSPDSAVSPVFGDVFLPGPAALGAESEISQQKTETYAIEFIGVTVENILRNVNFQIRWNEKIAIVGKSNSGKTLLLDALAGFCECKGTILYNGSTHVDLSALTMVSQEVSYVKGTVMENLRYGNSLSDEEVVERCKALGVHDAFIALENGYFKQSFTGGLNLSGGQKQRVHIVRGVLRDTPITIFDSCFSNINTYDATQLLEKIVAQENRTILAVIENGDHLKYFDKIILLSDSGVLFGTHEELKGVLGQYIMHYI